MKNSSENTTYDKIKHLVEVDDDILAVFSMISSEIDELYIAQNSKIDKNYINSLASLLELNQTTTTTTITKLDNEKLQHDSRKQNSMLGELKWIVTEYETPRILKIYESNKKIFVLIKSNTQLEHTVDNILGYYYDLDEMPRSLF